MKKAVYILLIGFLLTLGCNKDKSMSIISTIARLPFENDNIKLELVTSSVPLLIGDIFFFNASTGIAVSYDGKIYKTTDNGSSWSVKYTNPTANQPFYQILFIDANVGYVVGGSHSCEGTGCIPPGGLILKTIDGGNTWTTIFQQPGVEFISISKNNLGDLFAISNGSKGRIYKSTDSGVNWVAIYSFDIYLHKITFSGTFGFCIGGNTEIIRSSDNGTTWILTTTLTANYATDIKFNSGIGYCITDNQTVYKTTDNGSNWTQTLNNLQSSYVLNPLKSNNCIVFGAGACTDGIIATCSCIIAQTTNAGRNWTETELRDIEPIRYTSFYSATEGYAVAHSNLIKVTVK